MSTTKLAYALTVPENPQRVGYYEAIIANCNPGPPLPHLPIPCSITKKCEPIYAWLHDRLIQPAWHKACQQAFNLHIGWVRSMPVPWQQALVVSPHVQEGQAPWGWVRVAEEIGSDAVARGKGFPPVLYLGGLKE